MAGRGKSHYIGVVGSHGDEKEEAKGQGERLHALACWVDAQPWNAPGTDKTWVFDAWRAHRELREAFVRPDEEE